MSDQKTDKAAPDAQAQQVGADGLPKRKELTFFQHLGLWALVIVVGGLFGVSSSFTMATQSGRSFGGVDEATILGYQNVQHKLNRIFHSPDRDSYEQWPMYIKIARAAEGEGLMPSGRALDALVDDFLDGEAGPGRTVRDLLNESKGGPNEVSRADLRRLIGLMSANAAYERRHVIAPAVPLVAGERVASAIDAMALWQYWHIMPSPDSRDAMVAQEVELDAAQIPDLLKPVDDADPEINQAYDELRAKGVFTKPEAATLTVAYADVEALKPKAKEKIAADEAGITAWYEKHKTDPEFLKPRAADAKPETPQEPKALAEVKDEVVKRMVDEEALRLANVQVEAFSQKCGDLELDGQKDNTQFVKEAQAAGLAIEPNVVVEAPARGNAGEQRPMLQMGKLGATPDNMGLFEGAKKVEPGFVGVAVNIGTPPRTYAVVRLENRIPAGNKKPEEVKDEVKRYLQAKRSWEAFLKKAEEARTQAQAAGGLEAWLKTPEGAAWKATVKPSQLEPADQIRPPPAQFGQAAGDGKVAMSLAMPERPVALVEVPRDPAKPADPPKAKLVQVTSYTPAQPAKDVKQKSQLADVYRDVLLGYRKQLYLPERRRVLE